MTLRVLLISIGILPLVLGAADSRADTRRRIEATLFVPDPRPALEVETYG
jgi:hypothetical protein